MKNHAALAPLLLIAAAASGQPDHNKQTDITFVVAGKTANYRQRTDGSGALLNYHFFAEIFLRPGGKVTAAGLLLPNRPNNKSVPFTVGDYALELHGGRYQTIEELNAAYPDGTYTFRYTTPGTGSVIQPVDLISDSRDGTGLPSAPRIMLSQGGALVEPEKIDPDLDLRVTWSSFESGSPDPLEIMDDLLFVIMGDCDGVRRAHSGRPFEGTPFLTYQDTAFTIDAELLRPDNVYQLSVEHARLNTSREHDVVAFATFASTTFLDLQTTGTAAAGEACRTVRKGFDPGQTDR